MTHAELCFDTSIPVARADEHLTIQNDTEVDWFETMQERAEQSRLRNRYGSRPGRYAAYGDY